MPAANMGEDERELRDLLVEQKRRLWAELRQELFGRAGEELHTQYDIPQDIGERSILDTLADAGLSVADIHRDQLTALEEAQRRLEMGTYGRCEGCGEPIDIRRLRLVPYTAYCVGCQEKEDGGPAAPQRPTL